MRPQHSQDIFQILTTLPFCRQKNCFFTALNRSFLLRKVRISTIRGSGKPYSVKTVAPLRIFEAIAAKPYNAVYLPTPYRAS